MNKGNRLHVCLMHFAIYFILLIVPWMFTFEMLPITYANIPVIAEVILYLVWSILLTLGIVEVRKDIRNISAYWRDTAISKRMWMLIFNITWYLMLITLAFLILCVILIGISYIV